MLKVLCFFGLCYSILKVYDYITKFIESKKGDNIAAFIVALIIFMICCSLS